MRQWVATFQAKKWSWLFLGLMAMGLGVLPLPRPAAAPATHTIRVEASSFAYAPEIIHVNPGDTVTLELVSTDVVHGLYLDGYDLNLVADPGQTARISFVAHKSGLFRFRCSVSCGALHPFMIGKLRVGPNELLWRAVGLAMLATVVAVVGIRR